MDLIDEVLLLTEKIENSRLAESQGLVELAELAHDHPGEVWLTGLLDQMKSEFRIYHQEERLIPPSESEIRAAKVRDDKPKYGPPKVTPLPEWDLPAEPDVKTIETIEEYEAVGQQWRELLLRAHEDGAIDDRDLALLRSVIAPDVAKGYGELEIGELFDSLNQKLKRKKTRSDFCFAWFLKIEVPADRARGITYPVVNRKRDYQSLLKRAQAKFSAWNKKNVNEL